MKVTPTNAARLARTTRMYEHAVVYTTFRCTMHCPLCICRGSTYQPDLTREQLRRICDSLKANSVVLDMMTFSGGEPTLCGWLPEAIEMVKDAGIAKRVRVISNGVGRQAADYGRADIVYLSHYGACNRVDLLRLKRELGRRAVIRWAVHYPATLVPADDVLPASCACVHWGYVGDRVYPCGYTAAKAVGRYEDLWDDRYYLKIINDDPQAQPECRVCQWNERHRSSQASGVVLEAGIWDSSRNWTIELPFLDKAVRRVMRRFGLLKR